MSTEISYSKEQILDAAGSVDEQVGSVLGSQREAFFDTASQDMSRPDFGSALYQTYGNAGFDFRSGVVMERSDFPDLAAKPWHNMRVALGRISMDNRVMWHPATIAPGGNAIYLESDIIDDPNTQGPFSDTQNDALDKGYLTFTSSAEHGGQSRTNAAESRHGLVLASEASAYGVHDTVHRIDRSSDFTTTASAGGRLDIATSKGIRELRPEPIALSRAYRVAIRPEFQPQQAPYGLEISPQQLLIASTLAAARTRQLKVNIGDNVSAMVEAAR